jgi:hypothetical protein
MPPYLLITVWTALCLALIAAAFWRGRWPDRAAAIGFFANFIASNLLTDNHDWYHVQRGVLAADIALSIALFVIAARSRRRAYLVAGVLQAAALLNHLIFAVAPTVVSPPAYLATETMIGVLVLAAIGLGVARARR